MWCINVCQFHGATKVDDCLALIMDKCNGSVGIEIQTKRRETHSRSNLGYLLPLKTNLYMIYQRNIGPTIFLFFFGLNLSSI